MADEARLRCNIGMVRGPAPPTIGGACRSLSYGGTALIALPVRRRPHRERERASIRRTQACCQNCRGTHISHRTRSAADEPLFREHPRGRSSGRRATSAASGTQVVKDHRGVDADVRPGRFPTSTRSGCRTWASGSSTRSERARRRGAPSASSARGPTWPTRCAGAAARWRRSRPRRRSRRMDVVGFSLQYEMTFTNVLEMLDLAGIPLRASRPGEDDPLVVAGGPVVFNCEPIADFLDLVFVGDARGAAPGVPRRAEGAEGARAPRGPRGIAALAQIPGIYAPSLYGLEDDRRSADPGRRPAAPYPVKRRIVCDIDRFPFPDRIVVPHGEIVHDRVSIELMRGCPVGCRFCQAGYIYRPTRERDPNQVARHGDPLGARDRLRPVLARVAQHRRVRRDPAAAVRSDGTASSRSRSPVSLSSMHASTMTEELARQVRRVRKSGFTIAPEAGTQRLAQRDQQEPERGADPERVPPRVRGRVGPHQACTS